MGVVDLILIALALSMDAFAVSVCKGLSLTKPEAKHCLTAGAYFGGFQGLMPLLGYFLGSRFSRFITSIDHWIAFILLAIIGAGMIKEALDKDADDIDASFGFKAMLPLAVATSIDALAVGISFACLSVDIVSAALLIAATTFVLSALGVALGNRLGMRYKSRAELAGGIVLVLIGLKTLLEHLGILNL